MKLIHVGLVVALILAILLAPFSAEAAQPGKVRRIGYLSPAASESLTSNEVFLLQGLRDLGWVEGQSMVVERRYAEGRVERFTGLAAELVQLRVDVIIAWGTPAALAAKQATTTIPIGSDNGSWTLP